MLFAIALAFLSVGGLEAAEINCEKLDLLGSFSNCCFLNAATQISTFNITVAGLENVEVDSILFEYNKKIELLPVNVYKNFPNLKAYLAKNAAVKEISALNFARLLNLKYLDLQANKIAFIPNGCFEGLIKVNFIQLNDNKIAIMSGAALANLPGLVLVSLGGNVCIDKTFTSVSDSKKFRRKISKNCASTEAATKEILCVAPTACIPDMGQFFMERFNRSAGCCELEHGIHIDSPDYSFAADKNYSSLEIVYISYQPNIEFLPVSVYKSFPHLKYYSASIIPVQKISKANFEKMYEVEILFLIENRIEVIRSDTFDDLISLKRIMIVKNPLIALNAQALVKLTNLDTILLTLNDCIDKSFFGKDINEKAFKIVSSSCGFEELDSVEIPCERYQDFEGHDHCVMTGQTAINATNFVISELKDVGVEGIIFERNSDIEYLPYKIYMQFPNLVFYKAGRCFVQEISKENFEKLNRLKSIDLSFNRIKKISGNTFQGLGGLQQVNLKANDIKSINGRTFDQIPLLTTVDLRFNECIDEILEEGGSIKNFTRKIIQNCAFTETGERDFEKVFDIECGVGSGGSGYIVGGNEIKRGQWPFMAALLFEPLNQFFCGGNIITASHVLTAAHCVQDKKTDSPLEASQLLVLLGRHNISLRAELGSEIRGIKEIKVHYRWNPHDMKFEGDMAVLEMNRAVQFSELIQPVCLTVEPELNQREAGYVVGWGKSESSAVHENVPRQVLISSVTTDVCFAKDYKLGEIFAQGMYCAGGDEAGPCNGDSGGGFFVRYHGRWTLRGIVSSGSSKADGGCDVGRYSLFTNVLDYIEWIDNAINKNSTLSTWSSQNPRE